MWAVAVWLAFFPETVFAGYDYIDITNPFLRKIPLAVQPFKIADRTPEKEGSAAEAVRIISHALEFTGYFKLIDAEAFLVDSATPPHSQAEYSV